MKETGPASFPVGVAYVLPGLARGGTEKHVLDLASRLDRRRFSPCVVSTAGGGEMEKGFAESGVPVYGLEYRGLSLRPGKALRLSADAIGFFRAFVRILRERRVGILHAYLPAANVIGAIVARSARVPRVIVSKRALADYKKLSPGLSRVEPLANRLADAVLVNSDAVARDVRKTETGWKGKLLKVYNGVAPMDPWTPRDVETFRLRENLPLRAPLAVCVSNFHGYKRHCDLVDAVSRVAPLVPDAVFLLAGRDSGTLEETRERVRGLGLQDSVRFLGERTDVPDLLRACDLFLHPSREEGFSNAVLEAMSAGLPVVASAVGGNPEAVADGETGILVPPGDPAALASAVHALLREPARAAAMGRAGRERARDRFSLEGMVAAMEETYRDLLEGRPPSLLLPDPPAGMAAR